MSVVKSKRGKSKFEVLVKANELAAFTIRICSNEKNFPKRYRWAITSKIVNEAIDICRYIRKANKRVLNREMLKEYKKRRKYQNKALGSIDSMLALMDIAYYTFHIKDEKISHQRRKLKRMADRVARGEMTKVDVDRSYESFKANITNNGKHKSEHPGKRARRNCHGLELAMDAFYKDLWRDDECSDLRRSSIS